MKEESLTLIAVALLCLIFYVCDTIVLNDLRGENRILARENAQLKQSLGLYSLDYDGRFPIQPND